MSNITMDQVAVMSVQYFHYTLDYYLNSMHRCGVKNLDLWGASPHYCRLDYLTSSAAERKLREIRKKGDPCLEKVCHPVTEFNERLHLLLDDMRETLEESGGVGLAAPQVGILRRVCIVEDEQGEIIELINPEIIKTEGEQTGLEGCLSVPGKYGIVTRPMVVRVRAQDRYGTEFEVEDEELTARCFCHEIEHLDGHLYTEHCKVLTDEELEQYIREQEKELDEE